MAGAKPTVTRNRPVSQSSDSEPGIASFPRVSESDASDIAELVPEVFSQEVEQVLESGVDSGHLQHTSPAVRISPDQQQPNHQESRERLYSESSAGSLEWDLSTPLTSTQRNLWSGDLPDITLNRLDLESSREATDSVAFNQAPSSFALGSELSRSTEEVLDLLGSGEEETGEVMDPQTYKDRCKPIKKGDLWLRQKTLEYPPAGLTLEDRETYKDKLKEIDEARHVHSEKVMDLLVELDEDAEEDVRRGNKLRADLGSLTTFLNGHAKDVKDKMVELLAAAPVPAVAAVPAPQAGGVSGQADKRRDLVRESGSWSGN